MNTRDPKNSPVVTGLIVHGFTDYLVALVLIVELNKLIKTHASHMSDRTRSGRFLAGRRGRRLTAQNRSSRSMWSNVLIYTLYYALYFVLLAVGGLWCFEECELTEEEEYRL
ncbi:hypothetical protein EVAR_68198_1 [Eumeta japonica]|uniref:Uncharacterized protein n=1 Tax=Eumeta variegata TaxID=151549 RepID=A0A4C2A3Z4_EUMVA|nr:hypothetical protein EVAR_68198_1 [Eumeta japonica]